MMYLRVEREVGDSRILPVSPGRLRLGRDEGNDIVLDGIGVSRHHAELTFDDGRIEIRELGSNGGTRVVLHRAGPGAATRVRSEEAEILSESATLAIGDSIEIGSVRITVAESLGRQTTFRAPLGPGPVESVEQPQRSNRSLRGEVEYWQRLAQHLEEPGLVAASAGMRTVLSELVAAAQEDVPVLLQGETGVGKEILARRIHRVSGRSQRQFVALNCAALSDELFASELFGHRRGAFTGATETKRGLIELAEGGTLLLDEVGELSARAQALLLRLLDLRTYRRVGDETERTADVRVVAASHRDLAAMAEAGEFRSDLRFRLNGFPITIPPLRERLADILPLARLFMESFAQRSGRSVPQLDVEASRLLHSWHWPGNVRELRNVIERAAILARGPVVTAAHLGSAPCDAVGEPWSQLLVLPRGQALEHFNRRYYEGLLRACDWNISRAARSARVTRRNIHQVISRYGLERPSGSGSRDSAG